MIEQLWKYFHFDADTQANINQLKQENITDIHRIPLTELPKRLETNFTTGLDVATVKRRQEKYGFNRLTPPLTVPKWIKFCQHIFEGFSLLLWIGAALCLLAFIMARNDED